MATVQRRRPTPEVDYPSGDGKPVAETELHLWVTFDAISVINDHFARDPNVYVGGDLLLYYEEGNSRKSVAPDVLVALDVPRKPPRDHYLVWKEGKAPDFVLEITSKSTRREDQTKKLAIYRDVLKVHEYFLFDPTEDYLSPPLQGHRLSGGEYAPIEWVDGRVPSEILGLHLERDGVHLRFFDPATGRRLPTRLEARQAAERRAETEKRRAEAEKRRAETATRRAEAEKRRAEAETRRAEDAEAEKRRADEENERLRQEIEALRRGR